MLFQSSLGIYFSDNSVSLAFLKSSFKKPKLVAYKDIPVANNLSIKEKVSQSIKDIVEFTKRHKIASTDIFLGITREWAILREISFPMAVAENLRITVGYELEKYVPLPAENIYYDVQIVDENKQKSQITVLLVVIKKDVLEACLNLRDKLGLGVTGLEISSTAFANLFSVLSINGPDSRVSSAFVYFSSDHLEIGYNRKQMLRYAKSVKLTNSDQEIGPMLAREVQEMREVLGDNQGVLPLGYCGVAPPHQFSEYFSSQGVNLFPVDFSPISVPSPEIAVACGLAIKGLKSVPMKINLLPFEQRKRPSRFGIYAMLFLVVVTILSGIGWGGSKIIRQKLIINNLDAEIERLLTEIKNIDRIRSKIEDLETQINYLNDLSKNKVPILDILREVSERIPETAWVRDFKYSERGVQIYGFADSASDLVPLLEKSPIFEDVVFLSTITKGKDGKERFRIGFKIKA